MANYSSTQQLRDNCKKLTTSAISDAQVLTRLNEADDIVEQDLSIIIDFTLVTAADATTSPKYINQLSQYKTAELSYIFIYSNTRQGEDNPDVEYWQNMYKILLDKILDGTIDLGDFAAIEGSFANNVKEDVIPALGSGEYAGYIDEDEKETQNDEFGGD